MPRKANQKPVEEKDSRKKGTEDVEAEVKEAPKRGRKTKSATETTVPSGATTTEPTSSETKTRHVPTRESVEKEFDELVASIDEEIAKLREAPAKSKGVKFLRGVNKRVKVLRNHALRISRQKTATKRNNANSGFLKPVQISKDLAKFTGWDHSELRSRVDVTKFICNYIKEKNLQDPEDKRKIKVETDPALKKLLKYDGSDNKPLTYYSLQTYLKSHFSSAPKSAESGDNKPTVKPNAPKVKGGK